MVDQEVIYKLRMLSGREREVLKLFCEGNDYKTIGKILFISKNTVKTHMGNIYIKLSLDQLPSSARRMIIHQTYCPAVHEMSLVPQGEEPTKPELKEPESVEPESVEPESMEPEPVPDEVMEMVEKDEKALVVVEPIIVNIPPIEEEKPQYKPKDEENKSNKKQKVINGGKIRRKKNGWKWIVVLVMLALIAFGGFKLYELVNGFISSLQSPPAQAGPELAELVQLTLQAERLPTVKSENPSANQTNTIVIPTNTSVPTNAPAPTNIPAPKIYLPFSDNFESGINSPWSVGSGNWFVTDSGASISINDIYSDAGSIVIDDPTLTDYKLRVKVHTPHMYAASQGQFGVIVRYGSNRDQNIIFYMDSNGRFRWAYIDSLSDLSFYEPPITGIDKDAGSTDVTLEIEVIGNTFIARVDGAKVDQFSMTGYENGGIALITACGSIGSCPSFSDLSIEPIN